MVGGIAGAFSLGLAVAQQTRPTSEDLRPHENPEAVREYAAEEDELRAAVLAAFAAAGLVLESGPEDGDGEILTAYLPFTKADFGTDVATPPPIVSRTYPFYQPQKLGTGKYRMRATVEAREGGGRLTLTAMLRAGGLNRLTYEHQELDRTSNGTIERQFHDRIAARLGPATPAGD